MNLPPKLKPATVSLVLTPDVIKNFGRGFMTKSAEQARDSALGLFAESVQGDFKPLAQSKSVSAFDNLWLDCGVSYSQVYENILRAYVGSLGDSNFRTAYLRAITQSAKEFENAAAAFKPAHDLYVQNLNLYREHLADATNIASNFDEIFAANEPASIDALDAALKRTNFGLTWVFLFLTGHVIAPLWVLGRTTDLIRLDLANLQQRFGLPMDTPRVFGSLTSS